MGSTKGLNLSENLGGSPGDDQLRKLLRREINILLANIFLIIILGSLLVFTSVSFSKGRFDFN